MDMLSTALSVCDERPLRNLLRPPVRKTSFKLIESPENDSDTPHTCDEIFLEPLQREGEQQVSIDTRSVPHERETGRASSMKLEPKTVSPHEPESSRTCHHRQCSLGSKRTKKSDSKGSANDTKGGIPREISLTPTNPTISPLHNPRMTLPKSRRSNIIKAVPATFCCPDEQKYRSSSGDSFVRLCGDQSTVGSNHSLTASTSRRRSCGPPRPVSRSDSRDGISLLHPPRQVDCSRDENGRSKCLSRADSERTEFPMGTTRSRWSNSCGPYSSMSSTASSESDLDDALWPVVLNPKRVPRRFSVDVPCLSAIPSEQRKARCYSLGNTKGNTKVIKEPNNGCSDMIFESGDLSCDNLCYDNGRDTLEPTSSCNPEMTQKQGSRPRQERCNQDLHSEQALRRCSSSNHSILLMLQAMSTASSHSERGS